MTSAARELFRWAILRALDRNRTRYGINEATLTTLVAEFGFKPKPEETRAELEYLEDKLAVATVTKTLSPEIRAWRITATGRDLLEGNE